MTIDRTKYPELDLLLWDYLPQIVAPEHAFEIYETRWAYVDEGAIVALERVLIARLTEEFGQGIFLAA